ncbi:two-component system sensor kinase [Streptomyces lincolnensis]|uniref:Two-component system sensor kinase n=2 Tax=Streptomyces lincolnensis TaxID=1915 RepID=A0A1B1M8L4_STRLN|nr:two-component system sensor kinase [Streptomyces lincolnensis]AXG56927.1 two-component system sensor kinase [Streptomyces lincolnensis]
MGMSERRNRGGFWSGSWLRTVSCRLDAWQLAHQHAQEHAQEQRRYYDESDANAENAENDENAETAENKDRRKAQRRAARKAGRTPERVGPPSGFALLPWLLLGMGAFSHLFQGDAPNPWIGGLGLLTFNSLYVYVAFRSFVPRAREAVSTRLALVLMGLVTCGLAFGYGGSWQLLFPLLGLATGAVVRMPHLRWVGTVVAVLAGVVSVNRDGWGGLDTAYATWISTMVTAAILSLSEAVRELRAAREELARRAVEKERLRFSRDLHDLLGHTMSVIVVKAEAARRLADRDLAAALGQITDIESVGRQALTEIREAVTGYREGSLTTELDRARSALSATGVDLTLHRSGTPLPAQTESLLAWVVREAVTNVVRHSGASRCEVGVAVVAERVRLTVTDDGVGPGAVDAGADGTGLRGLTERLAAAGGSLTAGPGPQVGFVVSAELPLEGAELTRSAGVGGLWEPVGTAGAEGTAAAVRRADVSAR